MADAERAQIKKPNTHLTKHSQLTLNMEIQLHSHQSKRDSDRIAGRSKCGSGTNECVHMINTYCLNCSRIEMAPAPANKKKDFSIRFFDIE